MIDVEELICELHHIAGTERVDADIRRTACDAESALASLRLTDAEREAVEEAIRAFGEFSGDEIYVTALRGLLKRLA